MNAWLLVVELFSVTAHLKTGVAVESHLFRETECCFNKRIGCEQRTQEPVMNKSGAHSMSCVCALEINEYLTGRSTEEVR